MPVTIPKDAPLVYVSFSAEINPNSTENLIAAMADCANSNVKQVYLLLSTPGGNVKEGLNLYNVLKGMPFELITHNAGNVDSIGNAVFLAGNKRYATKHSTFMFHGVGFTIQNQRIEQKDTEEKLNTILSEQLRIGNVISERTKLSPDEVAGLFRQAQTKDAQFALDKRIIDEIKDIQITAGCPVISLVFKRP
jgi:ATP-dependent protease ClpP protease subunit